jgi:predicted RNA-binding protein YlxR (DUF448 family)
MRNLPNEPLRSGIVESQPVRKSGPGRSRVSGHQGEPERKCVLTGETRGRDDMLRLAVSPVDPDGNSQVLPDALARAPGRGAWVGVSRAALEEALSKGKLKAALARAFKDARLTIPEDLGQRAQDALQKAFLERLGLEMRAGKLILGSDRIADQARMGRVAWLAHAADASEDGSRKLDQAYRVGLDEEGSGKGGLRLPLDRAALSVALGRDNVVHLALADADSAERVTGPLRRLLHFTGAAPMAGRAPGNGPADAVECAATTN